LLPPKTSINDPQNSLALLSDLLCNKTVSKEYMSDERLRSAYRSYYHEQSFYKALSLFEEMNLFSSVTNFLKQQNSIHIADLATGTGGFVQGILHGLTSTFRPKIRISLQDRSKSALAAADSEIKNLYPELTSSVTTYNGILPDTFPPLSDVHILSWGNMLNEWDLTRSSSKNLLECIDRVLVSEGILLIAEPADRISSRKLHQFSDHLLEYLPGFKILAPCPNNRREGCPALFNEKDWCHEDRPHQFSQELIHKAKKLGHIKDSLKMSYLICQKTDCHPGLSEASRSKTELIFRMISDMTHERGLSKSVFCNGHEWTNYRLLKRYKFSENNAFFSLKKGQMIKLIVSKEPEKKGESFNLPEGTVVQPIDPS